MCTTESWKWEDIWIKYINWLSVFQEKSSSSNLCMRRSKKVLEFKNSNLNKDHMILPLLNSTDMIGRKAELFLPKKFPNVIWKVFRAPKLQFMGRKIFITKYILTSMEILRCLYQIHKCHFTFCEKKKRRFNHHRFVVPLLYT